MRPRSSSRGAIQVPQLQLQLAYSLHVSLFLLAYKMQTFISLGQYPKAALIYYLV